MLQRIVQLGNKPTCGLNWRVTIIVMLKVNGLQEWGMVHNSFIACIVQYKDLLYIQ